MYNRILFISKRGTISTYDNMDEPRRHYAR